MLKRAHGVISHRQSVWRSACRPASRPIGWGVRINVRLLRLARVRLLLQQLRITSRPSSTPSTTVPWRQTAKRAGRAPSSFPDSESRLIDRLCGHRPGWRGAPLVITPEGTTNQQKTYIETIRELARKPWAEETTTGHSSRMGDLKKFQPHSTRHPKVKRRKLPFIYHQRTSGPRHRLS